MLQCMPARTGTAHVVTTTRNYKDQVYKTHLLRRSYRQDGAVKNETLGNLSHLPESLIEIIRRSLQGETFVPLAQALEITRSRPHGHVQATALAMPRPAKMISMRPWTGCWRGKTGCRRSWLHATCMKAAWCCMTCLRATSRA